MVPFGTFHETYNQWQDYKPKDWKDNPQHMQHCYRILQVVGVMKHLLVCLVKNHIERLIKGIQTASIIPLIQGAFDKMECLDKLKIPFFPCVKIYVKRLLDR